MRLSQRVKIDHSCMANNSLVIKLNEVLNTIRELIILGV